MPKPKKPRKKSKLTAAQRRRVNAFLRSYFAKKAKPRRKPKAKPKPKPKRRRAPLPFIDMPHVTLADLAPKPGDFDAEAFIRDTPAAMEVVIDKHGRRHIRVLDW